ncbi:iron-siderophore ABC transporter substrate-binding protein [Amycolatopsis minnesotensis]|uniref:Iron-siderophore ABC transporter substrate-binding protein n=1 Tax=Amycolatopsis minnesotensis TaxID=337894 RepID=A0ABP5BIW6_9PSEU
MRVARALAVAAVLAATVVACGQSTKDAGSAPAAGVFPVSVAHKYGTTEIRTAPSRVVTLGLSDQDAALALDVKPVGVVDWFNERPFGKWPWTKDKWGGFQPEIVGERDDFNLEKIAALRPDLIVAQYSGMTKDQYDKLSKLAPVVAQPAGFKDYGAPWQDMARAIGKALGQEPKMAGLIDAMDRRYAEVRAAHPEFATQTVAIADTFKPGSYAVFAPDDPKSLFLTGMGFKLPEKITSLAGDKNVIEFGTERTDLLDVDRLIWLASDEGAEPRIRADPLYQRLGVVKAKRDLFLSYENPPVGAAISFNTVLSIPYALDQALPSIVAVGKQ